MIGIAGFFIFIYNFYASTVDLSFYVCSITLMNIQKFLSRKITRALLAYRMISKGERVLVAVSGGKDSMSLAWFLRRMCSRFPIPFEIHAVHLVSDIGSAVANQKKVSAFCKMWDIPLSVQNLDVKANLVPGKKLSCYWCSTLRRMALIEFARGLGVRVIALGHHQDDILETFLMNGLFKGELSTMLPAVEYEKFGQKIIRPLALIKESHIRRFAMEKNFDCVSCDCGLDENSNRRLVRSALELVAKKRGPSVKDNLFKALHNINSQYMPVVKETNPPELRQT